MILTKWQVPNVWAASSCRQVPSLQEEINQLFGRAFGQFGKSDGESVWSGWSPALDLYDSKDKIVVKAELPGMKKEEINISLQDGVLTVSGERKEEKELAAAETHRSERLLGRFQRAVRLPGEVEAEKIKATYQDGILTVVLPKAETARPKQIPVTIN